MSEKIDKRSKEYRDSKKVSTNPIVSVVETKDQTIEDLMAQVNSLTDTVSKLSKLTIQNTDAIKKAPAIKKPVINDSGAVVPRHKELLLIKKWLDSHSAVCAYSKDLIWAIAANKAYNNVAGLLGIIEKEPTLRDMAIKEGVVSTDYLSVIILD